MAEQIASQGAHLAPYILQVAGLVGFFASLVYWIISDHQSALMLTACLSLIGIGQYGKIAQQTRELITKE